MSGGKYELNCIVFKFPIIIIIIIEKKKLKEKNSTRVIKLVKSSSNNKWEIPEVILQELVCCLFHIRREEKI